MKIHSLEFQAIGPFPGKHEIDFELLGDSALVLIEGPTGAGKSTLLDAITFAFFGATEKDGSKERVRSHHANDADDSYVAVRFSTSAGTFKVRRVAERKVAKARGKAGLKRLAASCTLSEELSPGQLVVMEHQAAEAGKKITELLGMTREQFEQIVLLPQGEFETFLMSSTKDRKPLLEKIFNTQLYSRLKDKIHELALESAKSNEKQDELVLRSASALFPALEIEKDEIAEITSNLTTAQAENLALKKINAALTTLRAEKKRLSDEHNALAERMKALKNNVEKKRKEKLATDLVASLTKKIKDAQTALGETSKSMPVAASKWFALNKVSIKNDLPDHKTAFKLLTSEIEAVENLLIAEKGLSQLKEKRDASLEDLAELTAENASVSSRLEKQLPGLLGTFEKELKELSKVSEDSVGLLESKLESIEAQLRASKEVADLEEKVALASSEISSAFDVAAKSRAILVELEERRFSQIAFELSQQLQDGDPCQVCGSKEHPSKPEEPADLLTPEQLEKAKETLLADEALVASASKREAELAAELRVTKSKLKFPLEKLEAESEKLKEAILSTASQLERKLELTENLDGLKLEQTALRDRVQELAIAKIGLEEAVKQADVEISSLTAELAKATLGFESLDDKLSFLSELKDLVERLNEQQIQITSWMSELKTAEDDLKKLGTSKNFGDLSSAEDEVSGLEPELNSALERLTLVSSSVKKSEALYIDLKDALKTRASLLEGSVTLLELDRVLFQGRNPAKQTIDTFVLQNMFSEVVHAANAHFSRLLEGRYELRLRSDENTKGNAQTGLDLEILDLLTQKARAPKSLSGGEVFCASLSLALGLSDVVLSANGGIRIETFFIDEGFGSLDGERLNQVMEMLNMIQNTGRTVGVISHVEDMKQAILDRIEVKPQGSGGASTLSVSWAN